MDRRGIVPQSSWSQGRCPFCNMKLGKVKELERKIKKVYRCGQCDRVIDERFIIR